MDVKSSRARLVRSMRRHMDLTQAELAEALGVDRKTVSRWERGTVDVPGPVPLAMMEIRRRLNLEEDS